MADMTRIKGRIAETIYPNGQGAITAESHQALLLEMVDDINAEKADKEEVVTVAESVSILSQEVESNRINLTESLDALEEKVDNLPQGGGNFNPSGTYPDLTAGDLAGRGESVPAEFGFRASGGKSIKDGRAYIKELHGNAVVWNNMADTRGYEGEFIIREGVKIQQGHKYLLMREKADGYLYLNPIVDGVEKYDMVLAPAEYAKIFIAQYTDTSNAVIFGTIGMGGCVISDLTLMFRAGNEPSTIEEYEARKPIVADEYAYNEGEVIPFTAEGIKSVGDNALNADRSLVFDFVGSYENYDFINTEDAFVGISADGYVNNWAIDYAEKIEGGFRLHSNAGGYGIGLFVRALPNQEYSVSYASDNGRIAFGFYDKGKNLISYELWENRFTTPSNCEYIMLCLRDNEAINIDISFTDIMLTLVHSGWKVDTDAGYQPYWADTLLFNDPRIAKEFPNGMMPCDKVYNKGGKGYIVKGTGTTDLGALNWDLDSDGYTFYTADEKYFERMRLLCSRYTNIISKDESMNMYAVNGILRAFNSDYTDAASFKASLSGVILYYELAEPTIIEYAEPFQLDYKVADFGTEEIISEQNSAPFSADIIYQFNAVDMIREHELEITELQRIIATMQAQMASLIAKS